LHQFCEKPLHIIFKTTPTKQQQPFYDHFTGQPVSHI